MTVAIEPLTVADALAERAGFGPVQGLEPLAGGRNNRVFRLNFASAPPAVLKIYFRDLRDKRDRLSAEWSFLSYANELGVSRTPVAICRVQQLGAALYSSIDGAAPDIARPEYIMSAAQLIRDINRKPIDFRRFKPASEASFSLAEHLANAQSRVDRLNELDPRAPCFLEAENLVAEALTPAWARVRRNLEKNATKIGERMDMRCAADEIILSPSDFGFHNALIERDGGMVFLDFEYAGLDDPAKLTCDFFCQPEYSPPETLLPSFLREAYGAAAPRVAARVAFLLDLYRIKWACIVLNEFTVIGAARRQHADQSRDAAIFANQIRKARKLIATCSV